MTLYKRLLNSRPARWARSHLSVMCQFQPALLTTFLIVAGMGLMSSPLSRNAHADSNVNMSQDQFNAGYQNAQNNNWDTGSWGTTQWYIDGSTMYVSGGQISNTLVNTIGNTEAHNITSINFTAPVQLPPDSGWLFAGDYGGGDYNTSIQSINGLENMDTSQVQAADCMFENDSALKNLDGINNWNTSNFNNISFMFTNDNHLSDLNLSNWNVSHVSDMHLTFGWDAALNHIDGIGNWDTSQVNDMSSMFTNDIHLNDSINSVDNWNTSNVSDMDYLFGTDAAITHLDLDHWDTHNVTTMENMFQDTYNLRDLNVKNWNTENVNNMSDMFHGFDGSESLSKIDLSGWRTLNLQDMSNMFNNEANLREVDLNHFNTRNANTNSAFIQAPGLNHLVTGPDTTFGNVYYIPGFGWQSGSQILSHDQLGDGNPHPGDWHRDPFADGYYDAQQKGYWGNAPWYIDRNNDMHVGPGQLLGNLYNTIGASNAHSINSIDFEDKVQAPQDSSWLLAASSGFGDNNHVLQSINGTQNIDTSQVKYMGDMFSNDMAIKDLDLSNWDTSHVVDMNSIFDADEELQNLNVTNWDVSQVQNFSWAFYLTSLKNLDLSGWHTDNVNDLESMFNNNTSLQSLNLSNFNTSHVNNMTDMYGQDNLLSQITLGNDTRNTPLSNTGLVNTTWENGDQRLNSMNFQDNNAHPGTWSIDPFMNDFHNAQDRGQKTGYWGTAPWYIDDSHTMHVGAGQLQGSLNSVVPSERHRLRTIDLEEPARAPQDSGSLFADTQGFMDNDYALTNINGLENLDTSQVINMNAMFYNDTGLRSLNVSNWDTSHVQNFGSMFTSNNSLTDLQGISNWNVSNGQNFSWTFYGTPWAQLDLSNWRTPSATDLTAMFEDANNLTDLDISNFDTTHAKTTHMFGGDPNYGLPSLHLHHLALGNDTKLQSDSGLNTGLWQNMQNDLDEKQMMNDQAHPGDWYYIALQNDSDITGNTDESLEQAIDEHHSGQNNPIIINDQGSQTNDGMKAGNYHDIIYEMNGNYYMTNLNVYAYTSGDDLKASQGQNLTNILGEHYGSNVTVDDDGDSMTNGELNMGNYEVKYHYQDHNGNLHYDISRLSVDDAVQVTKPYLLVTDHVDSNDVQKQLVQFLGLDSNASLQLTPDTNDSRQYDYEIQDGSHHYRGTLETVNSATSSDEFENIPAQSDVSGWNTEVMKRFMNWDGINISSQNMNSYQHDDTSGKTTVSGELQPSDGQFINSPNIPYTIQLSPHEADYSVDNTINDQQVNDVLNSIGSNVQVISVLDNQGEDMTPSLHALSTIKNNTNITIRLKTDQGYATLHLASVSDLVESDVDINGGDLASQIQAQTHENDFRNFSVDDTHQITPNVQEVDYHFTKNVQADGNNVHVNTNDVTVSGTAYVHSQNINSASPTYMIIQGTNPIQHIENILGTQINVTQFSNRQDINNLPVGSYQMTYQRVDDASATENPAQITVIPNYYFGSITNDSSFDQNDPTRNVFEPNDYQHNGSYYKSVIDTSDASQDQDNNSHKNEQSDTVDGLHTQDGKPAHFDTKDPYLK